MRVLSTLGGMSDSHSFNSVESALHISFLGEANNGIQVSGFRSLSLVNGLYKVMSKALGVDW